MSVIRDKGYCVWFHVYLPISLNDEFCNEYNEDGGLEMIERHHLRILSEIHRGSVWRPIRYLLLNLQ